MLLCVHRFDGDEFEDDAVQEPQWGDEDEEGNDDDFDVDTIVEGVYILNPGGRAVGVVVERTNKWHACVIQLQVN